MSDEITSQQEDEMATGLASNDEPKPQGKWYEHENYADLKEEARRIAPKYQTETEAAKAGLYAQTVINRKVNEMIKANPGLLREAGLEVGDILKELGAVSDVSALAEYGGPPADDYSQAIKDSYDPQEEAALKTVCVQAGMLPGQIKAVFDYREQQLRQLDRVLRDREAEARRIGDAQKAEFQKRDGWSGDRFATNMTLAERAARQFGTDQMADSVRAMQDGKQPFDGAIVNVLHELAQSRVKEGQTITGEREKAGAARGQASIFDFPEMDNN
jgi:hypothetical protein